LHGISVSCQRKHVRSLQQPTGKILLFQPVSQARLLLQRTSPSQSVLLLLLSGRERLSALHLQHRLPMPTGKATSPFGTSGRATAFGRSAHPGSCIRFDGRRRPQPEFAAIDRHHSVK
jgi:hypothetical protein